MHPGSRHATWSRPGPLPFLLNEGPTYLNVMIRNGMMAVPSAGKGAGAIVRVVCRPAGGVAWRTFMVVHAPRRAAAWLAGSRVRWRSRGQIHPQGSGEATLTCPRPGLDYHVPADPGLVPADPVSCRNLRSARSATAWPGLPGRSRSRCSMAGSKHLVDCAGRGGACGQAIRLRCGGCHGG